MKITKRSLWLGALMCCLMAQLGSYSAAQDLPDAKTIIEKHLAALGPVEKMKEAKSMVTEATMTMEGPFGEMKASIKTKQKDGKAVIIIDMDQFGEMKQGTDGKVFWATNAMTGPQIMNKEDLGASAEEMSEVFPVLKWLESLENIEVAGSQKVDGKDCYHLRFKEGASTTQRFFDKETLMVLKTVGSNPMAGEVETFTSDYRKVGDFMVAHKQVTVMSQGEMSMKIEKVEFNPKLSDADFELPSDVKALLDK